MAVTPHDINDSYSYGDSSAMMQVDKYQQVQIVHRKQQQRTIDGVSSWINQLSHLYE
jgi:hypothetical protein